MPPWAPPRRSGDVAAAAPSDDPGLMAPRAYEDPALVPGFAEGPPRFSGPPEDPSEEPGRPRWGVVGAVVAGLAVAALIVVLAATRMGHRGSANAPPATTAVGTAAGGSSPSSAPSPTSPTPPTTPASRSASKGTANRQIGRTQASTIASYLTASGQARHGIGAAISAIGGCTNTAAAVTTLRNAADVRTHIVTELATADVSALPNGAAAVADLRQAMQASATADQHYAAWGQAVAGCHGHAPSNADFVAAQQSDTAATAAKQQFADAWNPIAAAYGLPKQTANTI